MKNRRNPLFQSRNGRSLIKAGQPRRRLKNGNKADSRHAVRTFYSGTYLTGYFTKLD